MIKKRISQIVKKILHHKRDASKTGIHYCIQYGKYLNTEEKAHEIIKTVSSQTGLKEHDFTVKSVWLGRLPETGDERNPDTPTPAQ